jgi:hypothetical protein
LYEQTRTQYAYEIRSQDNPSNQVKLGLALTGIDQPREALEKVASSKIIETATAFCRLDYINSTKRRARNWAFIQQGATAIEEPHRQSRASLIESRNGRIHSIKGLAAVLPDSPTVGY